MEQHAIDRYLCITEALGCGRAPIEFDFSIDPAEREQVQTLVGDRGPYAVLLPGTNWPTKRWPAERFAELVGPLRRDLGLVSVIAGGADAVPIAQEIRRLAADGDAGPLDLTGKTSLRQLVALLERATLVIANDSGPMHIAAALGRPLVTIFGPTNPIRTGPYRRPDSVLRVQIPCSPCYSRRCSHISCMRFLESPRVLEQAHSQIQKLNHLMRP
jgi:lipopolysaccharide heptosyltransferase II